MKFSDLPDSETLRLVKELSDNRSALNAARHYFIDQRQRGSAFDPLTANALEELRRQQNSSAHKHMLDLFSGAGSVFRPEFAELFRSNAQQAAIEAMKSMNSSDLYRISREAAAAYFFQNPSLLRTAAAEALRSLWRFDNPGFQALRRDAFAGTLMNFVRENALANEQAIEELQEIVDAKVASLPQGRISADGILNLIVTVILFFAGIAYNEIRDSQKPPASPFTETQVARLIESIEKTRTLVPEEDDSIYYIVQRQVCIRVKPNNRSAAVATLYPNQKVRLETVAHQWIYVEYFDYIEGIPKMGWVNKKYLERA
jgi:hypothetical protein